MPRPLVACLGAALLLLAAAGPFCAWAASCLPGEGPPAPAYQAGAGHCAGMTGAPAPAAPGAGCEVSPTAPEMACCAAGTAPAVATDLLRAPGAGVPQPPASALPGLLAAPRAWQPAAGTDLPPPPEDGLYTLHASFLI